MAPTCVSVCGSSSSSSASAASLAMPKSRTLTKGGASLRWTMKMFAGFKSRWMMPAWCAASTAAEICSMTETARAVSSGASWAKTSRKVLPSRSSITM
jgi:hypothetical protein